jgi:hypothetical protein
VLSALWSFEEVLNFGPHPIKYICCLTWMAPLYASIINLTLVDPGIFILLGVFYEGAASSFSRKLESRLLVNLPKTQLIPQPQKEDTKLNGFHFAQKRNWELF